MKVKVECTTTYNDLQLKKQINKGEQIVVSKERADELISLGLVRQIEVIKEDKKENTKLETKTEKAVRSKKTKSVMK